jgi:fumarylpyruvate hydrolase
MTLPDYLIEPSIHSLAVKGTEQRYPVHRVYCVGQNYADHALEMGANPERETPFFFSKPADSAVQDRYIHYPAMTQNLHHEVELVVALKGGGKQLGVDQVCDVVFGYAVGVDLTRRDLQTQAKAKGRPWDVAKGFDQAGPISELVPRTQWPLDTNAEITLEVNGILKQKASLKQLIWSVDELISELSKYYELRAGDLIFTGTPAGVGRLQPGDEVRASINGLPDCTFKVVS